MADPAGQLADELLALKDRAGLSLAQLAARSWSSRSSLERYLNGKIFPPRKVVQAISESCDGDTGALLALWDQASAKQRRDRTPEPTVPRQLPADVNGWTGRSSVLRELDDLVGRDKAKHPVGIAVITGMAGVGKTTVAVHWAHHALDRFPDGQLYLNLRGFDPLLAPLTPNEALHGLLQGLGLAAESSAGLDADAARYRSEMSQRRMLVILDNVADAEQVRPLLPGNADCLLVVTSRNELPGLVADGARPILLGPLSTAEAERLLAERCGADRAAHEAEAIKELAALCSGLPLALSVVGARAALRPDFSLDVLGAELRDSSSRLDMLSGPDARTDVRAVLSWSYRALPPETARVLGLLGVHPGPDVGAAAVASIADLSLQESRLQLEELRRAHLIEERSPGRYVLHDLLRVYAEEQVGPEDRQHAVRRVVDHYLHSSLGVTMALNPHRDVVSLEPAVAGIVPEVVADRVEAIDWYDVEHATLMAVIQLAEAHELDRSVVDLAEILRTHLNRSGRWQHWHDWITVQESAIRSARRSGDQPGEANALLVLGRAYGRLGRYEEVVAPCEASREICRRLDDLYGQAQAEQTLSMVADFLLRHDLSLDHARRALDLYHVIGYGVGELTMTHHIGVTYTHLGQYELALSYCLQALSWLQDAPEADYTELGGIWDSLGLIHLRMGDPHQAADYYGRSVGIYEEAGERYFHANALARVGEALAAAGDPVGAHEHRVSALAILDDLQHPDADTVRELL